jgi:hypothetical protein
MCGSVKSAVDSDGWTVHTCPALQDIQHETLAMLRYLNLSPETDEGTISE